MAKAAKKLHVRIPPYKRPRNEWRLKIHRAVREELKRSPVAYDDSDQLEVDVKLYMDDRALRRHDVDNRLKDVLDALQGRAGGSKKRPTFKPVILNDRQIYRVVIEKLLTSKQSRGGLGHITVRELERTQRARRRRGSTLP